MRTGYNHIILAVDYDRKVVFRPVSILAIRQIKKIQGLIALGSEVAKNKEISTKENTFPCTFEWLEKQNMDPSEPDVFKFVVWADADHDHIDPTMGLAVYAPKDPDDESIKDIEYPCFDGRIQTYTFELFRRMEKEGFAFYDY